jgi:hypothetical protein
MPRTSGFRTGRRHLCHVTSRLRESFLTGSRRQFSECLWERSAGSSKELAHCRTGPPIDRSVVARADGRDSANPWASLPWRRDRVLSFGTKEASSGLVNHGPLRHRQQNRRHSADGAASVSHMGDGNHTHLRPLPSHREIQVHRPTPAETRNRSESRRPLFGSGSREARDSARLVVADFPHLEAAVTALPAADSPRLGVVRVLLLRVTEGRTPPAAATEGATGKVLKSSSH